MEKTTTATHEIRNARLTAKPAGVSHSKQRAHESCGPPTQNPIPLFNRPVGSSPQTLAIVVAFGVVATVGSQLAVRACRRSPHSSSCSLSGSTLSGRPLGRTAPRPHAARFEHAQRIGEFCCYRQSRTFAELLIDCEVDRTLRAVLVGMIREG